MRRWKAARRTSHCCPSRSASRRARCRRSRCCPRRATRRHPASWARRGDSPGRPWRPRTTPPPPSAAGRATWVQPCQGGWWKAPKAGCPTQAWTARRPSCPGARRRTWPGSRQCRPARRTWHMCARHGTPPTPMRRCMRKTWCSPCRLRSTRARARSRWKPHAWPACQRCSSWKSPRPHSTTGWRCKANNWPRNWRAAAWCWWWTWAAAPRTSR